MRIVSLTAIAIAHQIVSVESPRSSAP